MGQPFQAVIDRLESPGPTIWGDGSSPGRDQSVRVAASLRNRVTTAHVVLERLANASPTDRAAKALTNLGRIVKTIYILRYIHEKDLRRRVQLQLNRGEFRSGDYEEIMNKASCLSLLSNAVLASNTMALMNIVTQLPAAGETIPERTWRG